MKLKVVTGSQAGREIILPMGRLLVGRRNECKLRPTGKMASRHHCVFVRTTNDVKIADCHSQIGTYVNDRLISSETILANGDRVRIGTLVFEILGEDASNATMAAAVESSQAST